MEREIICYQYHQTSVSSVSYKRISFCKTGTRDSLNYFPTIENTLLTTREDGPDVAISFEKIKQNYPITQNGIIIQRLQFEIQRNKIFLHLHWTTSKNNFRRRNTASLFR